jgi:hypothetical protein
LAVVCALVVAGCFDVTTTADRGLDAGPEQVRDAGGAAAPFDSASQPEPSPAAASSAPLPTDEQAAQSTLVEVAACVASTPSQDGNACRGKAEFTQCLHARCDFSGCLPACTPYADCVRTFDETCDAHCPPTSECGACLTDAANRCWLPCARLLACGETRSGAECDQLDDCCLNRLADERRSQCEVNAALGRALGGDEACAGALVALCPRD